MRQLQMDSARWISACAGSLLGIYGTWRFGILWLLTAYAAVALLFALLVLLRKAGREGTS